MSILGWIGVVAAGILMGVWILGAAVSNKSPAPPRRPSHYVFGGEPPDDDDDSSGGGAYEFSSFKSDN